MKQQRRVETYLGAALRTYGDLHDLYSKQHVIPITLDGKIAGQITANFDLRLGLEAFMHHYVLFECQAETPKSLEIESGSSIILSSEDIYFDLENASQNFQRQLLQYKSSVREWTEENKAREKERSEKLKDALTRLDYARETKNYKDTVIAVEDIDELANWRTEVDIGKLHSVLRTLKQPAEMLARIGIKDGARIIKEIAKAYNSLRWFMIEKFNVFNPEGIYKDDLDLESIAHYIYGTAKRS